LRKLLSGKNQDEKSIPLSQTSVEWEWLFETKYLIYIGFLLKNKFQKLKKYLFRTQASSF